MTTQASKGAQLVTHTEIYRLRSATGRLTLHLLVLLFLVLASKQFAGAHAEVWAKLMIDGRRHSNNPTYYLKALKVAEQYGEQDPRVHIALSSAAYELRFDNPTLAESLFRRDITNLDNIDPDYPELSLACFELANIYQRQGKYSQSIALLKRAISIRDKWHNTSSNNPFNAEIFASLYLSYYCANESHNATDAYNRMLNAARQFHSTPRRRECLEALKLRILQFLNRPQHATPQQVAYLKEVVRNLPLQEGAVLDTRGDLCARAERLYGLARTQHALGNDQTAERLTRQSMAMLGNISELEKTIDLLSSDTELLCQIMLAQNRCTEAFELQQKFLFNTARLYGSTSSRYAAEVNSRARFWEDAHHPELAQSLRRHLGEIQGSTSK